jgi:hypothetical protein
MDHSTALIIAKSKFDAIEQTFSSGTEETMGWSDSCLELLTVLIHHWSVWHLPDDCHCEYLKNHVTICQEGMSKTTKISKQDCQCNEYLTSHPHRALRHNTWILEFMYKSDVMSFPLLFDHLVQVLQLYSGISARFQQLQAVWVSQMLTVAEQIMRLHSACIA